MKHIRIDVMASGRLSKEERSHAKVCYRCSKLMEMVATPPLAGLSKLIGLAKRVNDLLKRPRPDKIDIGQIWRLKLQEDGTYPLCVIVRGEEISIDRSNPDVRICPINLEAEVGDIDDDDVIVDENESPLEITFLAEYWNECPISADLLDKYIGDLNESAWKRLCSAVENRSAHEPESLRVKVFRSRRVREIEPLSVNALSKAYR